MKVVGSAVSVYPNDYFELDASGTTKHIYAGSELVASIESDNNSETVYYAHSDHLGGSSVITDSAGTMVQLLDYYPFGETRIDRNFAGSTFDESHKFTGQELDEDSGLYYYGARYYSPFIGRFMSQDPWSGDLSNPQSLNKYSYVLNNPLRYTDPTGESATDVLQLAWGTAGGFALADGPFPFGDVVGLVIGGVGTVVAGGILIGDTFFDNTPPGIESSPYVTPSSQEFSGINTTTLPGTKISPWIEKILAPSFEKKANIMTQKGSDNIPRSTLPKDKSGNYLPDAQAIGEHTTLGTGLGRKVGRYRQGATFNEKGEFIGRTDVTNHGRGDHVNPHFHPANSPNGTKSGSGYNIRLRR